MASNSGMTYPCQRVDTTSEDGRPTVVASKEDEAQSKESTASTSNTNAKSMEGGSSLHSHCEDEVEKPQSEGAHGPPREDSLSSAQSEDTVSGQSRSRKVSSTTEGGIEPSAPSDDGCGDGAGSTSSEVNPDPSCNIDNEMDKLKAEVQRLKSVIKKKVGRSLGNLTKMTIWLSLLLIKDVKMNTLTVIQGQQITTLFTSIRSNFKWPLMAVTF